MNLDSLTTQLNAIVSSEVTAVLKRISTDYSLDYDELISKYVKTDGAPEVKKARGRKKKDDTSVIETVEFPYQGTTYLVDTQANVYTYNVDKPMKIGTKLIDGTIKFSEAYLKKQ